MDLGGLLKVGWPVHLPLDTIPVAFQPDTEEMVAWAPDAEDTIATAEAATRHSFPNGWVIRWGIIGCKGVAHNSPSARGSY